MNFPPWKSINLWQINLSKVIFVAICLFVFHGINLGGSAVSLTSLPPPFFSWQCLYSQVTLKLVSWAIDIPPEMKNGSLKVLILSCKLMYSSSIMRTIVECRVGSSLQLIVKNKCRFDGEDVEMWRIIHGLDIYHIWIVTSAVR